MRQSPPSPLSPPAHTVVRRWMNWRRLWNPAWILWLVTLAMGCLALALRAPAYHLSSFTERAAAFALNLYWLILIPAAVPAFATVGIVIAARRRRNPIGWLCLLLALSIAVEDVLWQFTNNSLKHAPDTLMQAVAVASALVATTTPLLLTLLLHVFPSATWASPGWRWAGYAAGGGTLLQVVTIILQPLMVTPTIPSSVLLAEFLTTLGQALTGAALVSGVVALIVRWRRADGAERVQLTWLVYVGTISVAAAMVAGLWLALAGSITYGAALVGGVAVSGITVGVPLAIGRAVLHYRLYDIDLLINRTLVYSTLSLCVIGLYVLIVGYIGGLLGARDNIAISLLATSVVAILFQPIRERLQRTVNRMVYGERDEPYNALTRLGQRLEAALEPDAVLPTIVDTVREALKLPYVAVELAADEGQPLDTHASHLIQSPGGVPAREQRELLRLPLKYHQTTVGTLLLAPRTGDTFSPADQRLLTDLARQAGIAAHAIRLHTRALQLGQDLQQSRERLVNAREEERRRLRRDLHDGLGPALATLTLKVDAALEELGYDPQAAAALLHEIKGDISDSLADIRRLVYALRPPALDDLGLVTAIQTQVRQYQQSGLHVILHAPTDMPPLPAAVEVAAYRIVMEGVTNVGRHAGASHVWVTLALHDAILQLRIADDGRGLPADLVAGVGLRSMRERVEELGGGWAITQRIGGGTELHASLPVTKEN